MTTSINKRNKEKQRQERQREKEQKRQERKDDRGTKVPREPGVDPDIAGIVPRTSAPRRARRRLNRRNGEAAQRFAERRRREDEAPRLSTEVPKLLSLRLELREARAGITMAEVTHARRVVVERAPALFEMPCQDTSCKDGGHDITHQVMRALREGKTQFTGEHTCTGQIGTAECRRTLSFAAYATFKP